MSRDEQSGTKHWRILFIINPKSGKGINENFKKLIEAGSKISGSEYRLYTMTGNDREQINVEINRYQPDFVAAAGGDGTINLMAEILTNTDLPLGIIPSGSANGMSKELGIPARTENALEVLFKGKTKEIDLLKINGKTCIHLADVGLNARIVKRFEMDPNRGIITYAKYLFGEMFLLKKYTFNLFYDGKSVRRKGVSITFANARQYGTGAVINPRGKLNDGKFELVIIKPFPRIKLLSIAWKMFTNTLHTSDYAEIISCTEARVLCSRKTTLQIDGEVIGKVKEIIIECIPRALKVIVP